ncbi:hemolysin family protein [Pelagicoccus sp. SDUM812002]|uniref:hemolysin family protein n=1 Tax=Pelagicoccus sp. SDUM812002 TaxID=3041266 RepID=UPI00281029F6|nr:hemolysin family protein [Pelagicoccus sp. SDUM812002]MDQ8185569.1 hemolysin family protein [Pelagicoccus sp. SDUM812002]
MITQFVLAVVFTVGVSFVCSMLEALILSTTIGDIESLKKRLPPKGELLEAHKTELSDTISAILTLNTIANTAGSTLVGSLAIQIWDSNIIGWVTGLLTLSILIFSEIIPKNLGVTYRIQLQPWVVSPLRWMKIALWPATTLTNISVRFVVREEQNSEDSSSNEEEIILLAEKGAKDGTLTSSESDMVTNALKLDDEMVSAIMTPRVVVTALEKALTIGDIFRTYPNIPFARLPVYDEEIDQIVGLVRRRDLLKYVAEDQDRICVGEIMNEVHFVPETVTVSAALQSILKTHQQLLVVVDEFGSMAGVVTMEDIMEYILGREIFEKDDVAIDMREFARSEAKSKGAEKTAEDAAAAESESENRPH